jgi:hypothetical protein
MAVPVMGGSPEPDEHLIFVGEPALFVLAPALKRARPGALAKDWDLQHGHPSFSGSEFGLHATRQTLALGVPQRKPG